MAPKTQVNSATGIMGPTGTGKSSLAATLADYLWANWQKVLLLYSSDGGGFPAEVQARIALGTIRVFRMRTRDTPQGELAPETCYRAAQGWWPRRIHGRTGQVDTGVEMVPPVALRYEQYCQNGHLVKSVVSQSLLTPGPCPQCTPPNNLVTATNMRVETTLKANRGFEDVGGVFYDGLTSMLSWEMMEMGHRAGRMELKGEEGSIGGKVVSGDLRFGSVTRSHVGFAQTRGEEIVHLTMGIPNLMVPPVFTMLTHEDVDDRALSIRGPKIAGRAKTDEAGQWFGNMLEAAKVAAEQGKGYQFCLYLDEFTDENAVKHLIKHRGSPGTMPSRLIDPVDGPPFSEFNLGKFFSMLDVALANRIAEVAQANPGTPGVSDEVVEIGDPGISRPVAPVVTQPARSLVIPGSQPPSAVSEAGTPAPPLPAAPAAPPQAPAATKSRKKAPAPAAVPPVATPVAAGAVAPPESRQEVATTVQPSPSVVPAASVAAVAPASVPVASPAPVILPGGTGPGASPAGATPPALPAPVTARPAMVPPPGARPGVAPAPRPPVAGPRPPTAGPRPIPPTTT